MYMLRTLPVVLSLSILLPVPMATIPVVRGADHAVARAVSPGAARAVAVPARLGPPWISIEYPVNPYDQTTRSAFMLVHSFHHGTAVDFPVSGSAEGLVKGERRSIPLRFSRTSRQGVFAVSKQWPNEGVWTLVVSVTQGKDDKVSAVVELSPSGEVASMRVPTRRVPGESVVLPAAVSMADVETSLRARAAELASGK